MAELLEEAAAPEPKFAAVVCGDIERSGRDTFNALKLERELQDAGVPLFATDEPASVQEISPTTVLVRRVKQGVAEYFRLAIKKKAWEGLRQHTLSGWNIGPAPYGYLSERVTHPVPMKAAQGRTKTRLVLDPVRGPVVAAIFTWRVDDHLAKELARIDLAQRSQIDTLDPDPANTAAQAMRHRCYERFAEFQTERETTQTQLAALDQARARDDDATLLDDLPLLASTIDLEPEHIQAALYQAFDIQALYKDDMHQVSIFATITTSTPQAVAAILTHTGPDPAARTPDLAQPSALGPAETPAIYPLTQRPIRAPGTQIMQTPPCRGLRTADLAVAATGALAWAAASSLARLGNRDHEQRLSSWNRPHIRQSRRRVVGQTLQNVTCALREDEHHVRPGAIPVLALRGLRGLEIIEVCADFSQQHVGDPYPIDGRCFPLHDLLEPLNHGRVAAHRGRLGLTGRGWHTDPVG
jgi:hypothetical protein